MNDIVFLFFNTLFDSFGTQSHKLQQHRYLLHTYQQFDGNKQKNTLCLVHFGRKAINERKPYYHIEEKQKNDEHREDCKTGFHGRRDRRLEGGLESLHEGLHVRRDDKSLDPEQVLKV